MCNTAKKKAKAFAPDKRDTSVSFTDHKVAKGKERKPSKRAILASAIEKLERFDIDILNGVDPVDFTREEAIAAVGYLLKEREKASGLLGKALELIYDAKS